MLETVEAKEEEVIEGMTEEGAEEGAGVEWDEHVWTDPANAKDILLYILQTFSLKDPVNEDFYKENYAAYAAELVSLSQRLRAVAEGTQRTTIIFGDRFPFRYLVDSLGLQYYAAFPGCSTETEASAATIAFLIDKVREETIPVVFHIEFSNKKIAEAISEATGAQVRRLHSIHNVTKEEFSSGVTYLDLMSENVLALEEALK
jgi:zinc transport system substrate-binding protein